MNRLLRVGARDAVNGEQHHLSPTARGQVIATFFKNVLDCWRPFPTLSAALVFTREVLCDIACDAHIARFQSQAQAREHVVHT